jgi:TRAP-type C4-dicarboxylate transport system substrate-binding protein
MKAIVRGFFAVVAGTLVLVAGSQTSFAGQPLRMSSQWTETTAGAKVDKWWAAEIDRRTNGEVKIKIFWEGVLGKAKENLGLIQNGSIDLAAMSPGYFPAELPFHAAPNSIPMAMSEVNQATELMERLLTEVPEYDKEAQRNGMKALFFHHLNPYKLVCKEHIKGVADMKGKKVRTWGKDMPRMVQAAGGVPVTLGLPELYEGLSRGTVDCIPFSMDLMVNYKINAVWVASGAWDNMTTDQKKAVQDVSFEAARKDRDQVVKAGKDAIATLESKGVQFHKFPDAEKKAWKAANPDFFGDFIAEQEKLGRGDDARKTIKIWNEVVGG